VPAQGSDEATSFGFGKGFNTSPALGHQPSPAAGGQCFAVADIAFEFEIGYPALDSVAGPLFVLEVTALLWIEQRWSRRCALVATPVAAAAAT
jgi:hypothetical protein